MPAAPFRAANGRRVTASQVGHHHLAADYHGRLR
jgi:hypothetical protein